jgi:Ca-activated chloride channel homolog
VVYAGSSGLVLPATRGDRTQEILDALERLNAGGSTAGGAGIQLAYKVAREHFNAEAVNRVILCTDGDFNVGLTQRGDLERLIEDEAKSGVFLTVLGLRHGQLQGLHAGAALEQGQRQLRLHRRLQRGAQGAGGPDARHDGDDRQGREDPGRVQSRPGRRLPADRLREPACWRKEDFNNDKIDAGDIGAGHTVTAFYELIPAGQPVHDAPAVDPLK